MRRLPVLALLCCAALSQDEAKDPYLGKPTRIAAGPEGRVTVKIPATWTDLEIAGNQILRVKAPGAYGGHDLRIEREEGQDDTDKQRERYLEFDSANAPTGTVVKLSKPYFGYRINNPDKNRVLCRAFVGDGADGLVISVTSRFTYYDKYWADLVGAILGSVSLKGGARQAPELTGELRRLYDKEARVSIVVPSIWKPLKPESRRDLLYFALKGARTGPRFVITDHGAGLKASMVLLRIGAQWKKSYRSATVKRVGDNPPRLLVKNRIPGSVDYLIAFDNEDRGFTFQLTVREGSFEKFRSVADEFAKSIAFTGGKWKEPVVAERELKETYKNLVVLHASVDALGTLEALQKSLAPFYKHWPKIAPAYNRKAPPLHLVVVGGDEFAEQSHYFGTKPAAYDRVARAIVVAPIPKEKEQQQLWKARVYWMLAEAALHRDLAVGAPPWLRAGLCGCMEVVGRSGKGPDAPHDAYLPRLVTKIETDAHLPLVEILQMSNADIDFATSPDRRMQAWAYLHMMLYGKTGLSSKYRKWAKVLAKARASAPVFDLKTYDKDKEELKKHAFKYWVKK
ncbi:MAG: hypothetical protein ACYTGN_11650 [Planctomycetota bacterium]|jgi:hypothetical protein